MSEAHALYTLLDARPTNELWQQITRLFVRQLDSLVHAERQESTSIASQLSTLRSEMDSLPDNMIGTAFGHVSPSGGPLLPRSPTTEGCTLWRAIMRVNLRLDEETGQQPYWQGLQTILMNGMVNCDRLFSLFEEFEEISTFKTEYDRDFGASLPEKVLADAQNRLKCITRDPTGESGLLKSTDMVRCLEEMFGRPGRVPIAHERLEDGRTLVSYKPSYELCSKLHELGMVLSPNGLQTKTKNRADEATNALVKRAFGFTTMSVVLVGARGQARFDDVVLDTRISTHEAILSGAPAGLPLMRLLRSVPVELTEPGLFTAQIVPR